MLGLVGHVAHGIVKQVQRHLRLQPSRRTHLGHLSVLGQQLAQHLVRNSSCCILLTLESLEDFLDGVFLSGLAYEIGSCHLICEEVALGSSLALGTEPGDSVGEVGLV